MPPSSIEVRVAARVDQARAAGVTRDAISTITPRLEAAVKRWEAREAARVDQPSEDGWRHARCDQHDHAQAQGHRQAMRREQQHELIKRGRLASREMRPAQAHSKAKRHCQALRRERHDELTKPRRLAPCEMRSARARPSSTRPSSDEARATARVDQARTACVTLDAISTCTPRARGRSQAMR